MSTRVTKRQLQDLVETQRFSIDRMREQIRFLEDKLQELRTKPEVTRTDVQDFCTRYCAEHNTRSVPGDVVRAFINQRS